MSMERFILGTLKDAGVQLRATMRVPAHHMEYIPTADYEYIIQQDLSREVAKELLQSRKGLIESCKDDRTMSVDHRISLFVFTPEGLCEYAHKLATYLEGRTNGNNMDISGFPRNQELPSYREEDSTSCFRIGQA